jgi:hypothetical protein
MSDKLSEDVASEQIENFLDYYEIDLELDVEVGKDMIDRILQKLKKSVQAGRVEFNSDGTVVQYLKKPSGKFDTIKYNEMTGKAKLEAEKIAGSKNMARVYALLGALSGLGINAVSSLKGPDLTLAECIGVVFSWA